MCCFVACSCDCCVLVFVCLVLVVFVLCWVCLVLLVMAFPNFVCVGLLVSCVLQSCRFVVVVMRSVFV